MVNASPLWVDSDTWDSATEMKHVSSDIPGSRALGKNGSMPEMHSDAKEHSPVPPDHEMRVG